MENQFAIVEVMGHRSHAGRVSEVEAFGGKMCRIETPALPDQPETSRPAIQRSEVTTTTMSGLQKPRRAGMLRRRS